MRTFLFLLTLLLSICSVQGQTINAAYVKKLYKKYPTEKSSFCDACVYWNNSYYQSIADTERHMPLITYYVYTRKHRLKQETLNLGRKGIYAAWHHAEGQPEMEPVHKAANQEIGMPNTINQIAYGHCQAWILLAYTVDGALLSDTYDFNEGFEYHGQNIGTEEETEDITRRLTGWKNNPVLADSVQIWCGTFGSQRTFSKGDLTVTVPSHYWKILKYYNKRDHQTVTRAWWMPNKVTEKRALLPQRTITLTDLKEKLGFDPMHKLQE